MTPAAFVLAYRADYYGDPPSRGGAGAPVGVLVGVGSIILLERVRDHVGWRATVAGEDDWFWISDAAVAALVPDASLRHAAGELAR